MDASTLLKNLKIKDLDAGEVFSNRPSGTVVKGYERPPHSSAPKTACGSAGSQGQTKPRRLWSGLDRDEEYHIFKDD